MILHNNWRFFPLATYTAFENMAIDESLFRAKIADKERPNSLRLYMWSPGAVSIGKHQELEKEIDLDAAKAHGVDIIRRISGGGAVFHDNIGEITYSIIASIDQYKEYSEDELVISLLKGLQAGFLNLGLETTYDKIHCPSLFVNGKKISGNAQARHKDVIMQHGTILFDYRPELMYTLLKARPDKPREKMIESVYAFVTTIKKELGKELSNSFIADQIEQGFKNTFGIETWLSGELTDTELKLKDFYLEKRFTNKNWLFEKEEVELN